MKIDVIDLSIIGQSLLAIAREMGQKLVNSAYSPIIREARDASTAILDRNGQIVAQAEMIPIQLGSMGTTLRPCLEKFPPETLREGDFLINNHPYYGGQHLQDVFIFTPVFFEGELICFAGSTAHHLDIGGRKSINRTPLDLYQEGVVLPPMKLRFDSDWQEGSAFRQMFCANIRMPEQTLGDFEAQFAANALGEQRVLELARRYGSEGVQASMTHLIDYSEAVLRASIKKMPDGVYEGEDRLDDCDDAGQPLTVRVKVTVQGDQLAIDYAGTSAQFETNMNAPVASSLAAAFSCVKSLLVPSDVPFNEGTLRPVVANFPLGSFLNPIAPAAVGARMEACYRIYCATMKAMAQALPEIAISSGFDASIVTRFALRLADGRLKIAHEVHGGGFGAAPTEDGADGIAASLSNVTNTPVEAMDMEYPHVRIREYALAKDSCGYGKYRGGLGLRRSYEVLLNDVEFSCFGDRFEVQPTGLAQGTAGSLASCTVQRRGTTSHFDHHQPATMQRGDIVTITTSGGAGHGDVRERSPERIAADLADGYLSWRELKKAGVRVPAQAL